MAQDKKDPEAPPGTTEAPPGTETPPPGAKNTREKKGAQNEPPPLIKPPPKEPDKGGKTWADIMNEMFDLPSDKQMKWAKETGEALLKRSAEIGAQRELFAAAKRYIKDPENNPPVEGAPYLDNKGKLSLPALVDGWGPNGKKIENAVKINNKRVVTEAVWRIDKENKGGKQNVETNGQGGSSDGITMDRAPNTIQVPTSVTITEDTVEKSKQNQEQEIEPVNIPKLSGAGGPGGSG